MSTADLVERAWWAFQLPAAVAYVPANSETDARAALVKSCYERAPVHTWPLIRTRVCSRQALVASLAPSDPREGG